MFSSVHAGKVGSVVQYGWQIREDCDVAMLDSSLLGLPYMLVAVPRCLMVTASWWPSWKCYFVCEYAWIVVKFWTLKMDFNSVIRELTAKLKYRAFAGSVSSRTEETWNAKVTISAIEINIYCHLIHFIISKYLSCFMLLHARYMFYFILVFVHNVI